MDVVDLVEETLDEEEMDRRDVGVEYSSTEPMAVYRAIGRRYRVDYAYGRRMIWRFVAYCNAKKYFDPPVVLPEHFPDAVVVYNDAFNALTEEERKVMARDAVAAEEHRRLNAYLEEVAGVLQELLEDRHDIEDQHMTHFVSRRLFTETRLCPRCRLTLK